MLWGYVFNDPPVPAFLDTQNYCNNDFHVPRLCQLPSHAGKCCMYIGGIWRDKFNYMPASTCEAALQENMGHCFFFLQNTILTCVWLQFHFSWALPLYWPEEEFLFSLAFGVPHQHKGRLDWHIPHHVCRPFVRSGSASPGVYPFIKRANWYTHSRWGWPRSNKLGLSRAQ